MTFRDRGCSLQPPYAAIKRSHARRRPGTILLKGPFYALRDDLLLENLMCLHHILLLYHSHITPLHMQVSILIIAQ